MSRTICVTCDLYRCACRSGQTTVQVSATSPDEAKAVAVGYLERRGYTDHELLRMRFGASRMGMVGRRAYDLVYRIDRKQRARP